MNLIINHVDQLDHIHTAHGNRIIKRLAGTSVIENRLASKHTFGVFTQLLFGSIGLFIFDDIQPEQRGHIAQKLCCSDKISICQFDHLFAKAFFILFLAVIR